MLRFPLALRLIATVLHLSRAATESTAPVVVNTTGGPIEGYVEDRVRFFDGVPYAAPPVGNLRWAPPHSVTPWEVVRPANKTGPPCQQRMYYPDEEMSEDCLYLNVRTPVVLPARPMPVQFWLHGGGMKVSTSTLPLYRGKRVVEFSSAAADEPVIVVTTNYRLDEYAMMVQRDLIAEQKNGPLNYGLQDMCFALQWVQENIAAFGGDPKRVMLYGESGGATATSLLLFADRGVVGCGTMSSAVAESVVSSFLTDVIAEPNMLSTNLATGDNFTAAVDCTGKGVDCLRSLTPIQIQKAKLENGLQFDIVIDGAILRDWPGKLLMQKRFHHIPIMMGSATNEATKFDHLFPAVKTKQDLAIQVLNISQTVQDYRVNYPYLDASRLHRVVEHFSERYSSISYQYAFQQYINSVINKCDNLALVMAYAEVGLPSFMYEWVHGLPSFMFNGQAGHGAELAFVWSMPDPNNFTTAEQRLANQTMAYWAAFAATGTPNAKMPPPGSAHWPAVVPGNHAFNSTFGIDIKDKLGALPSTLQDCAMLGSIGLFPTVYRRSSSSGSILV